VNDTTLRTFVWAGVAVGVVAVFMILEMTFRALTNRYGTPQDGFPHRRATELPRVVG